MASGAEEPDSLVILAGRVDASTVSAVRESVHSALDHGSGPLVVDLTDVHTVDITGLAMLIGAQRKASTAGRAIVLRGVPVRVSRLLRATHLDRAFAADSAHSAGAGG